MKIILNKMKYGWNNGIIKMKCALDSLNYGGSKRNLEDLRAGKMKGESYFIAVMVAIIIVLVIAAMYRENITTIFQDFFSKSKIQINGLFPS